MLPIFSQNLPLQEAFETSAKTNNELKKLKLLTDSLSSFFCKMQKIFRENDPSKEN